MKKLLIILSLFLVIGSCKDDCPEPDPCDAYPKRFEIENFITNSKCYENINTTPYYTYPYNTYVAPNVAYFSTNYDYDSVRWIIGQDPSARKGNTIRVDFNQPHGEIDLTAIGYRSINAECFGRNDDGIDTLTKSIQLIERLSVPILVTYRGKKRRRNR